MHFVDVDEDVAVCALLKIGLQLVDFRSLASDDDAWAGCVNRNPDLVSWPLDLDLGDSSMAKLLFQLLPKPQGFVEQRAIVLLGIPAGVPGFVVSKAETEWMNFLSQDVLPYLSET